MHRWRGAHAWCARVERALHACARVQGAEQRARAWQWRGEARCATCLFVRKTQLQRKTQSRLSAMRAYTGIFLHADVALELFAQCACPASALLRAAPCCSPFRAASPLRHGAQANVGIRKSQEAAKQNGSISSFSTPGRGWHNYAPSFFVRGWHIQHRVRSQPHGEKLRRQPHGLRWRAT